VTSGVAVRVADPGRDWTTWRDLRLRALRDSPSAFGSTYEREVDFTETQWRQRVGGDGVAVLATVADDPVGMAGGFRDLPGLLHVIAMWVDPGHRRRGVSGALLRGLEEWADAHGLRLHLDVNTSNRAARTSYERYGFVATGETRPLREGSGEVVERMVLSRPGPHRPCRPAD
jgi:GNAT superfamily N-acetyltransferase